MTEEDKPAETVSEDRRLFMTKAGKFVAIVPPAMVLMLSASMEGNAIAQSDDGKGGSGKEKDKVKTK